MVDLPCSSLDSVVVETLEVSKASSSVVHDSILLAGRKGKHVITPSGKQIVERCYGHGDYLVSEYIRICEIRHTHF